MSGVWVAYQVDWSGLAIFDEDDEVGARRYANENFCSVGWSEYGKDLGGGRYPDHDRPEEGEWEVVASIPEPRMEVSGEWLPPNPGLRNGETITMTGFGDARDGRYRVRTGGSDGVIYGSPGSASYTLERIEEPEEVPTMEKIWWNGEACSGRRLRVIVPDWHASTDAPLAWWKDLAGTERPAVLVEYGDQRHLLDDEDGIGWAKVTEGKGSPRRSHSDLPLRSIEVVDGSSPGRADA